MLARHSHIDIGRECGPLRRLCDKTDSDGEWSHSGIYSSELKREIQNGTTKSFSSTQMDFIIFNQESNPCSWKKDSNNIKDHTFSLLLGSSPNFHSPEATPPSIFMCCPRVLCAYTRVLFK